MSYQQIPRLTQDVANIALMVWTGALCREKITGHRIVSHRAERIAHSPAKLARNENA